MARTKLDDHFREELRAIEQWFTVLSEPERTTALYSLLQKSTQVQVRFFITVLQQIAQRDQLAGPLSPAPAATSSALQTPKGAAPAAPAGRDPEAVADDDFVGKIPGMRSSRRLYNRHSVPSDETYAHILGALGSGDSFMVVPDAASAASAPPGAGAGTGGGGGSSASGSASGVAGSRLSRDDVDFADDFVASAYPAAPNGKHTSGSSTGSGLGPIGAVPSAIRPKTPVDDPIASAAWSILPPAVSERTTSLGMSADQPRIGARTTSTQAALLAGSPVSLDGGLAAFRSALSPSRPVSPGLGPIHPPASPGPGGFIGAAIIPPRSSAIPGGAASIGMPLAAGPSSLTAAIVGTPAAPASSPSVAVAAIGASSASAAAAGAVSAGSGLAPSAVAAAALATVPAGLAHSNSHQSASSTGTAASGLAGSAGTASSMLSTGSGGLPNNSSSTPGAVADHITPHHHHHHHHHHTTTTTTPLSWNQIAAMPPPATAAAAATAASAIYAGSEFSDDGGDFEHGDARSRSGTGGPHHKEKGKIPESVDLEAIKDIPSWLRSLRLHKYTPIFENDDWRTMIKLSEDDLIRRGVAALGARRKMLKVFELVRKELSAKGVDV
nr:hypothetical protein HK105_000392 [Polyrhizophydium stewartii]